MEITFLGHAGFAISIGSQNVIIDPFLTNNPSATQKKEEIKADYILITHAHGDHLGDAFDIAKLTNATIVAITEITSYAENQGLKTHGMNTGGSYNFGNFTVKLTSALHSSSLYTMPPTYMGLASGFLITAEGKTIYHAGDSALFGDMALLSKYNIDLALLPIGDNYTMGPDDAMEAIKLLQPKKVIPMHYNTWPIISQDAKYFQAEVEKQTPTRVEIKLPGEKLIL